jgi:hypothetical protein
MTTKILIPRGSGEGGIGAIDSAWGQAYFDTGNFNKGLFVSGKNIQQVVSDVVVGGGLGGVWDSGPAGVIYYNGGNVGIGTTNPSTKLDVVNFSNTEVTSTFNNAGGSAPATIHIIEDESSISHVGLFVGASDLSSAVLTTKHTSVGIGTRNPNGNLDINSKTTKTLADHSIAAIRLQNGFTSIFNSALIDARTDVLTSGVTDYTDKVGLMFASMGNEHMRIDSTGNVGIGTPSPVSKLDIHGSLSFKSKGTYVSATNAGGDVNSNDLTLTAANSTNSIVARSAQNIIFQVFDPAPASVYREVMRITPWGAGGNVGIGTTNPGAKLEVAGNLKVNGKTSTVSENTGYDTIGGATAEVTLNSTSEDAMYLITASRHSTPTQAPTFETGYVVAHGVGNPIYYFQVLSGSNISISTSANKVIATNGAPSGIIYLSVLRLH